MEQFHQYWKSFNFRVFFDREAKHVLLWSTFLKTVFARKASGIFHSVEEFQTAFLSSIFAKPTNSTNIIWEMRWTKDELSDGF